MLAYLIFFSYLCRLIGYYCPSNTIKMADNQLIFRSFASGSSGNCYFLGTSTWGILIDAGISARTIQKNLREMGLDYANIMGVLITHDHADHIRAVGTLGERVHLPIYSTRDIHDGIDRNYGVREKLRTSQRYFGQTKSPTTGAGLGVGCLFLPTVNNSAGEFFGCFLFGFII